MILNKSKKIGCQEPENMIKNKYDVEGGQHRHTTENI